MPTCSSERSFSARGGEESSASRRQQAAGFKAQDSAVATRESIRLQQNRVFHLRKIRTQFLSEAVLATHNTLYLCSSSWKSRLTLPEGVR